MAILNILCGSLGQVLALVKRALDIRFDSHNFVKIFMEPCSSGPILMGKGFDDEDDDSFLILVSFSNSVHKND